MVEEGDFPQHIYPVVTIVTGWELMYRMYTYTMYSVHANKLVGLSLVGGNESVPFPGSVRLLLTTAVCVHPGMVSLETVYTRWQASRCRGLSVKSIPIPSQFHNLSAIAFD